MATYYTTRCPFCGTVFFRETYKEPKSFGSTEQMCCKCNKTFMYSSIYEWENLTNEEKKSVLILGPERPIRSMREIKLRIFLCSISFFLLYPLYYLVTHIKDFNKFKKYTYDPKHVSENEYIQESVQRTQDPEYRRELLKLGRTFYGKDYQP